MKKTEIIMGMPITIELADDKIRASDMKLVFDYFHQIDERFSPYKTTSELSKVNEGLQPKDWSSDMTDVMKLCEETKLISQGYFDISIDNKIDPSGLVKGWAINNAALMLRKQNYLNYYIEAGGDIAVSGYNSDQECWRIGIRNPFNIQEIIKTIMLPMGGGIATSGTYIRGQHIYDPVHGYKKPKGIVSMTVIGPNIFEADRIATAAFAMGEKGVVFINRLPGFEAYQVDEQQIATMTEGFEDYVAETN